MKILVTAGNTITLIDQVRGITNIFSGRTGAAIALQAAARGHIVTLLTSRPETVNVPPKSDSSASGQWAVEPYRTFADLQTLLESHVIRGKYDAIVHSAAVSDYECHGVFAPTAGVHFDPATGTFEGSPANAPIFVNRQAAKVKSGPGELWLRLLPTPKLVDQIRDPWGFPGVLVKFKLEVGIKDYDLLAVAEASRRQSRADLMVANTLEGMGDWAMLGPMEGAYQQIERANLSSRLLDEIERMVR